MPGVPPNRFAYLGPAGTFTEQALRQIPAARNGHALPRPTVVAAIDAVRGGAADGAVVPLENSVEGSVASTVDELAHGEPLMIAREIIVPVGFSLLARSGTTPTGISTVATHPHAEAQCRRWLAAHFPRATVEFTGSTAGAAAEVASGRYDAAIAAPLAGEQYRLEAIATDIADTPGAVTRFVLLVRPGAPGPATGADRTSIVAFIRANRTGALMEVLTEFATRGINLTRIESRPTRERIGTYLFCIDCDGHVADARVGDALAALHRICADVRFLGSYPRADGQRSEPEPVPAGRTDSDFADAAAWLRALRAGPVA